MDPATIQAARRGSRTAQGRLLEALQDRWYRVCLSLLGDSDMAREATQETAMRFLRDLPAFRGESQLSTWAIGIAINVAREMRRQRPPPTEMLPGSRASPDPPHQAELAEDQQRLRMMLEQLPERQREALVLRFFEDLSVDQTAAAMGCAPGTVKATVHQAIRALREKLDVGAGHAPPSQL